MTQSRFADEDTLAHIAEQELALCRQLLEVQGETIAQQAAVIEQMREALTHYAEQDVINARHYPPEIAKRVLALQPCPEVLNKVRADAVIKFGNWVIVRAVGATNIPMTTGTVRSMSEHYAQQIEQGEA